MEGRWRRSRSMRKGRIAVCGFVVIETGHAPQNTAQAVPLWDGAAPGIMATATLEPQ